MTQPDDRLLTPEKLEYLKKRWPESKVQVLLGHIAAQQEAIAESLEELDKCDLMKTQAFLMDRVLRSVELLKKGKR